jgi:hypothetical protein
MQLFPLNHASPNQLAILEMHQLTAKQWIREGHVSVLLTSLICLKITRIPYISR